jgi:hypothetical protein
MHDVTVRDAVDDLLAVETEIVGWAHGADYPKPDLHGFSPEEVEKELWRRVNSLQNLIVALSPSVEYGLARIVGGLRLRTRPESPKSALEDPARPTHKDTPTLLCLDIMM